jgi:hypothetical protein
MSGEPTEQRSDAPTVDCVNSKKRTVQKSELRSQNALDMSGAATRQRTSTVNRYKPQRADDVAHTGHRTVPCPVHHRTIRCVIDNNG